MVMPTATRTPLPTTTTTTKARSEVWCRGRSTGATQEPIATQLSLGLLDIPARVVMRRLRRPRPFPSGDTTSPTLLAQYVQRLAHTGLSAKTQQAYIFQVGQLLGAARRHGFSGHGSLLALFRDDRLLGLALTDDASATAGILSRWTLAQRRSAVRAFARLMAPELRPHLSDEPETIVARALRGRAERVGSGFRLSGGAPRRRGGPVPPRTEVAAIIAEAGRAEGYKGARNHAFFTLLYETGSRVNALRGLTGDAVFVMPSGRLRLMLHAKGQAMPREVELSQLAAARLTAYVASFNREATIAGRCERITLGEPGPVWRSSWRGQWAYDGVVETFQRACFATGAPAYGIHALRRAFATDAAATLPRHVVARAGGWRGLQRLDNHYIRPHRETVADKLDDAEAHHAVGAETHHAGTAV